MNKELSTAYTLVAADNDTDFVCTGSFAITVGSPSDFARDFDVIIKNDGSGTVTLDGYVAKTLAAGASCRLTNVVSKWVINDMDEAISGLPLGVAQGGTGVTTANAIKDLALTEKSAGVGVPIDGVLLKDASVIAETSVELKAVQADGFFGTLKIKHARTAHTLTNARTNRIFLTVPQGAKIIGAQLINKTAIFGTDDATGLVPIADYSAAYFSGATQAIAATIVVAINTQTDKIFDVNADTDITTDPTDIVVDAGVGNKFTAGGVIQANIFYMELVSITHA